MPIKSLRWSPFLPLLTVNPEYGLVELWNFPLNHGPEAVPQLVVVLLQFLLVLPLLCGNEPPVLLYRLAASEGERGRGGGTSSAFVL